LNKIMWLPIICLTFLASVQAQMCRVIAFSGGGSFGSYEAGVFNQLVNMMPAQEVMYNAVVGISAGSFNSFAISQFQLGQEPAAAALAKSLWLNLNGSQNAFVDWPGGIITGVCCERGAFNDKPLHGYLGKYWGGKVQRNITISTCNLNTGMEDNYNETVGPNNIVEMCICSASIPGFFPFQSFMGGNYVDGGTIYSIDIPAAIKRCYDVTGNYSQITIDMSSNHHFALNSTDIDLKTYEVYQRAKDIRSYDQGMYELYWALQTYPQVNFRYYIMPSVSLGKVPLNFTNPALTFNYNLGLNDTANIIKKNILAKDIVNDWIANNGGYTAKFADLKGFGNTIYL